MNGFGWSLRRGLRGLASAAKAQYLTLRRCSLAAAAGMVGLVLLGGGALALAALASGVGVTISSNPKFCDSCHEVLPAYEQWRVSSHKSVNCLTCHTDEGLAGYVQVSLEGLGNLAAHLGGRTELPSRASLKSESRQRCHSETSLPETLPQASLRISHSSHRDLDCTTCHARLVHPRLVEAPVSAQRSSHVQRDCSVCHPSPNPTYLHGDAQVACASCHSGNIPGHDLAIKLNTPARETCVECHVQQRVSQPQACQTCHVSPHGVDPNCGQCHSSTESWQTRSFVHPVSLGVAHGQIQCLQCPRPLPAG